MIGENSKKEGRSPLDNTLQRHTGRILQRHLGQREESKMIEVIHSREQHGRFVGHKLPGLQLTASAAKAVDAARDATATVASRRTMAGVICEKTSICVAIEDRGLRILI